MIAIQISNDQSHVSLDEDRLCDAVRSILQKESVSHAEISIAVVDDPTIRRLHRKYLDQDDPTDVLSFVFERGPERLEAEVVVSAETAAATAPQFDWEPQDELLLYVIHGTLHLIGYDDTTPQQRAEMRRAERAWLAHFGREARYEPSDGPGGGPDAPLRGSPSEGERDR